MMEYIKKVRACIRWLLEREDANLAEIERINGQLEATHKQHSEIGTNLCNYRTMDTSSFLLHSSD